MINPIKTAVVTGGAGFIGSNLVDSLLSQGVSVRVLDNLSTGKKQFLTNALANPNFKLFIEDLYSGDKFDKIFEGADAVFHFAANADVRFGPDHTSRDLEQNTIVTQRVLDSARKAQVKKFIFSSTGSVYGESQVIPTPEDSPFPIQTSLYGASKLAGEGLVCAYSEAFDMQVYIFRFVSILGPRYTHGHVYDFYNQLLEHSDFLNILGDGYQKKSYLHVDDCIKAIFIAINNAQDKVNIYNLGVNGFCEVRDSVGWIIDEMNLSPKLNFGTDTKGWIGDNPMIHLKVDKIAALGWQPRFTIEAAVRDTINYLSSNNWALADLSNR